MLDYYGYHTFPITNYAMGNGPTENIAFSISRTKSY